MVYAPTAYHTSSAFVNTVAPNVMGYYVDVCQMHVWARIWKPDKSREPFKRDLLSTHRNH